MSGRRVVFRADASHAIGAGHVMRCLTLADALGAEGFESVFLCRPHPGHLGALIARRGHGCILLDAPSPDHVAGETAHADWLGASIAQDAGQCRAHLRDLRPDWLVVDHYALDASWERELRPLAGRVLALDDLADRPHACDLLLDQNLNRRESDYDALVPVACRRLIGPSHALLRPGFAALRDQSLTRRAAGAGRRLLVSLGGMDEHNLTCAVLARLDAAGLLADWTVTVVAGGAAPHRASVRACVSRLGAGAELRVDVADMAALMSAADLAIGGVGVSAWERCCLGLPTLMVILAENQRAAAQALAAEGAGALAGAGLRDLSQLDAGLARLRDPGLRLAMARAAAGLVDGRGAERVVAAMRHCDAAPARAVDDAAPPEDGYAP